MSQEFQEHWLSAYLDNELSTDERALVERRLEEDPEARELLEDLKRVRGLVATLPTWQGDGFRFDMSRVAGEDEPGEEDDGPVAPRSTPGSLSIVNDTKSSRLSVTQWRVLLSLAAGLLVVILSAPLMFMQFDAMAWNDGFGGVIVPVRRQSVPRGSGTDVGYR